MKRYTLSESPDTIIRVGQSLKEISRENPNLPYVNVGIGVFHSEGHQMPQWYQEALRRKNKEVPKSTYHFAGNPEFLENTARLVFGNNVETSDIYMAPSYGGSQAISIGSHVLKDIVPVGIPTYANHEAIINGGGSIFYPYRYLNERGEFDVNNLLEVFDREKVVSDLIDHQHGRVTKALCRNMGVDPKSLNHTETTLFQEMGIVWLNTREVAPLIQAVCNNPLGVDIPCNQWEIIADELVRKNITLQVDLAYFGLGKGIEKDSGMLKYFKSRGVKMLIYFSYSKFHGHYADRRAGSVMAVNFDKDPGLLSQVRETTSAVAVDGQRLSNVIELNPDIQTEQRMWLEGIRGQAIINRQIISEALNGGLGARINALDAQQGPFLYASDLQLQDPESWEAKNCPLMPWMFPELAEKMGYEVSTEALDFPSNQLRVAGVPILPEEAFGGAGGVRIALPNISEATARDVARTLKEAYKHLEAQEQQ